MRLWIVLVYIGTERVETNLGRIRDRVLAGGHNVPEEDVRRRYKRSFENLATALQRADYTILFDNSTEEGYPSGRGSLPVCKSVVRACSRLGSSKSPLYWLRCQREVTIIRS